MLAALHVPAQRPSALCASDVRVLDKRSWHKCKGGYVRQIASTLHNGIWVARNNSSPMLSNTSCTALLSQGAPVCPDSTPT